MGELKLERLMTADEVADLLRLENDKGEPDEKKVWKLVRDGTLKKVPGLKPMKFTAAAVQELMAKGLPSSKK